MKLRVLTVTAAALTLVAASTHIVRTEEEDDLETGRAILKNGSRLRSSPKAVRSARKRSRPAA